ncbi:sensor histidine kinase [Streptococcus caprae]|uniref:histidine kinase n=1 Tax=Streptococcus caprae TaxID=1640501 RepID=A0ABV8CTW0_9STRE
MKTLRTVQYTKYALLLINFVAIVFYASVYLFSARYVSNQDLGYALLEKINTLPLSPNTMFFSSIGLFLLLFIIMIFSDQITHDPDGSVMENMTAFKFIIMVLILLSLQFSFNGIILLVFADVFYSSRKAYLFTEKHYWFTFIFLSFGIMLVSNYDWLSLLFKIPLMDTYVSFYPSYIQIGIRFVKNLLVSLNNVVFIVSLVNYVMYAIKEHHNIETELQMVSRVNVELNSYIQLTEKIVEDRERKRIAREIHDTLGHALTGISAGIDAVKVLVDLDANRAKFQLNKMSEVVREGIVDVRRSLEKLRPDALENQTLRDALQKMIDEYQAISPVQIEFDYQWDVDLKNTTEDIIFRVVQESITNSIRHGHARHLSIQMVEQEAYVLRIQDDGVGCEEIHYGYGLKQMQERLAMIGGRIRFEGTNGFLTEMTLPKLERTM